MTVSLHVWSRSAAGPRSTRHANLHEALGTWLSTRGRDVGILATEGEACRRPTPWECAGNPLHLLATEGFVALAGDAVRCAAFPDELDSDYLRVVGLRDPLGTGADTPPRTIAPPPQACVEVPEPPSGDSLLPPQPAWFARRRISGLAVPPSLRARLAALGCRTVADACRVERSRYAADVETLRRAFDKARRAARPEPGASSRFRVGESPLMETLSTLVADLSPRQRDVLARTLGLGRCPESMASVGRGMGISRERVRQLVARAVQAGERRNGWPSAVAAALAAVASDAGEPGWMRGMDEATVRAVRRVVGSRVSVA